jgi:hypothetical protein
MTSKEIPEAGSILPVPIPLHHHAKQLGSLGFEVWLEARHWLMRR